jgi:hypothetical protein
MISCTVLTSPQWMKCGRSCRAIAAARTASGLAAQRRARAALYALAIYAEQCAEALRVLPAAKSNAGGNRARGR